ncbi:MAG: UPF0182 family protein, partial [Elusimicrobia bacterium]|nr:UPF0182 family protein [Elusimicrobiota bacterium]
MTTKIKLAVAGGALALAVFLLAVPSAELYLLWLWFKELGYSEVFAKTIIYKLSFGVFVFFSVAGSIIFNLKLAEKFKSDAIPQISGNILAVYGAPLLHSRFHKLAPWGIAVISYFFAKDLSGLWYWVCTFFNHSPFGKTDPIFGLDISFYVFTLGPAKFAVSWL